MSDLARTVVELHRNKMILESPAMIRECLDLLADDQIWWRPNPSSNSVGNLVLHLCGATRHFWGRGVVGSDYVRDRDGELHLQGQRLHRRMSHHWAFHAGQIVFVTKQLREGTVTDLMRRVMVK